LQEYPVRLLREILETYSPSGSEAPLANLLRTEMDLLGFDSRIDDTGNVVGEAGGEGPEILLCGHMDTVPGEIPVLLKSGFLSGRGAVDAKSSLAAIILGSAKALESKIPVKLRVACVVAEETTGSGFRSILSQGPTPHLAIFGEPSGLTNVVIGYKGRVQIQIECLTDGGHAAAPWLSRNSAEEAYGFWSSLRKSLLDNEAESKFNSITGCLTGVHTTGPENSIPARTRLTVDIRVPPETKPDEIKAIVESEARSYSEEHPGVQLFMMVKDEVRPYIGNPHSKLVAACRGAIRRVTGETPVMIRKTGTSDMNLLSSTQAVAYGPGNSKLDHTDQERINVSEYLKSIEVYAEILRTLARLPPQSIEVSA
jgi:[amino group carrier protein]-lysine/ornithine hydrolase